VLDKLVEMRSRTGKLPWRLQVDWRIEGIVGGRPSLLDQSHEAVRLAEADMERC